MNDIDMHLGIFIARLPARLEARGRQLLDAWTSWHRRSEAPPAGPLCDLIATLAHLLGGVAHELRRRPRDARELPRNDR